MTAEEERYQANIGDIGCLPLEPCRFCRKQGGVCFLIDDGPEGKAGLQTVICNLCNRTCLADSSNA